jgi:hypothetical protein
MQRSLFGDVSDGRMDPVGRSVGHHATPTQYRWYAWTWALASLAAHTCVATANQGTPLWSSAKVGPARTFMEARECK